MWKHLKEFLILLLLNEHLVSCEFFSVVGSKTLRIDQPYDVAVTSHSLDSEKREVLVAIEGTSFIGKKFKATENVEIGPGETKVVEIELYNLMPGKFFLKATSGNFSKSVPLYCNPQRATLIIQPNKPIFTPNDFVEFRVFAVNARTNPYSIKFDSKIRILDPGNNQVKVWKDPKFHRGLFQDNLQLADAEPGTWKIIVEADGDFESKTFEVRKDLRPLLELVLTMPSSRVAYRDGSIKVKAKVKAVAKNSIVGMSGFKGILSFGCIERGVEKFKKTQRLEDETFINIDFKNDLGMLNIDETRSFELFASFFHDETNKTFQSSKVFFVEISDFKIRAVHSPKYFKPGIPYIFTLQITRIDGFPVLNSENSILVTVSEDNQSLVSKNFSLDPHSGTAKIFVNHISMNATSLDVTAVYGDFVYSDKVHRFPSKQNEFLVASILTPRPMAFEPLEIEIISTANVPFVVFQIISKGLLRTSKIIELTNNTANFKITPTFTHSPEAHFIAFYINSLGDIVSDSITLHLENLLPNSVNLTLSSNFLQPGEEFTIEVESTLNSTVSLVAVDQRAFSTDKNFEITQESILHQELIRYDRIPSDFYYDPEIPFWFWSESYQKKFIDVDAVILTNAVQEFSCNKSSTSCESDEPSIDSSPHLAPPPSSNSINEPLIDSFLFKTIQIETPVNDSELFGSETLTETAPDLVGSWIISGIALSKRFGLALTEHPISLSTFKLFYIDFTISTAIKLGEIIQLEFLVVNLLDSDLDANVTFFNGEFKFIRPAAYNWFTKSNDGLTQTVTIPKDSLYRFRIEIKPNQVGITSLKVAVKSSKAGDEVERQLMVIPEGFAAFENHAQLVSVDDCETSGSELIFSCVLPHDVVNGTVQVQASVTGDVLGPALANLEYLIRMPIGSGEQTMINFAPTVVILNYLTVTGHLTPKINEAAINYLKAGYQKMLKYRRNDGSFSAFGKIDKSGSTWLTGYVVKYFREAQKFIIIDDQIITEALEFIVSKQGDDGRFREDGVVIHKSLQSGTASGVAFTAYLAAVVQESVELFPQYEENVEKAVEFVKNNCDNSDVYSLALATYLLHVTNNEDKIKIFENFATKSIGNPGRIHWKSQPQSQEVNALDIEITSYGLLVVSYHPQYYKDGFKILRWLMSNQNSKGGFLSTQDTVVGIQAIAKFATKFTTKETNLSITLQPDEGPSYHVEVNQTNSLMTQTAQLNQSVRNLTSIAQGKGFAVVQLSCSYYRQPTSSFSGFNLSFSFDDNSCDKKLILSICASFIPTNLTNVSNMAVIKLEFPSGFSFDSETVLPPEIQKVEEISKGVYVNFYLNKISVKGICFNVIGLKNSLVYGSTSSTIEVMDLYNSSQKSRLYYKPPSNLPNCGNENKSHLPYVEEYRTTETLQVLKPIRNSSQTHPPASSMQEHITSTLLSTIPTPKSTPTTTSTIKTITTPTKTTSTPSTLTTSKTTTTTATTTTTTPTTTSTTTTSPMTTTVTPTKTTSIPSTTTTTPTTPTNTTLIPSTTTSTPLTTTTETPKTTTTPTTTTTTTPTITTTTPTTTTTTPTTTTTTPTTTTSIPSTTTATPTTTTTTPTTTTTTPTTTTTTPTTTTTTPTTTTTKPMTTTTAPTITTLIPSTTTATPTTTTLIPSTTTSTPLTTTTETPKTTTTTTKTPMTTTTTPTITTTTPTTTTTTPTTTTTTPTTTTTTPATSTSTPTTTTSASTTTTLTKTSPTIASSESIAVSTKTTKSPNLKYITRKTSVSKDNHHESHSSLNPSQVNLVNLVWSKSNETLFTIREKRKRVAKRRPDDDSSESLQQKA